MKINIQISLIAAGISVGLLGAPVVSFAQTHRNQGATRSQDTTGTSANAQTTLPKDLEERLNDAEAVFHEVMSVPEKSIPTDLLERARCVAIIPGIKKGAFIVGGQFGKGFITCRKTDGTGWTAPGNVRVEGGSVGFQIGGQEEDAIMLVMNKRGEDRLLSSQFTVGADASVAAGPVGRTAAANTDAYMSAEILTWARSRGVFAGVALKGATLRQDMGANHDMYGGYTTNKEIIEGNRPVPAAARPLIDELTRYSPREKS